MKTPFRPGATRSALLLAGFCLGLGSRPLTAQTITTGGITATVRDERGTPLRDVTVTVERAGTAFRIGNTDPAGRVGFLSLTPGQYTVLAEQVGYQPVRYTRIRVSLAATVQLEVRLIRRPPPVNSIEQRADAGTTRGAAFDQLVAGGLLHDFDRQRDLTSVADASSTVDAPRDGRTGFVTSAGGLAPRFSHLVVDGVEEVLLRHPGLPFEPASAPIFGTNGFEQAQLVTFGLDAEWPALGGATLAAVTRPGSGKAAIHPWISYSGAKLGGRAVDNPADSSASTIEAGFRAGGAIKGDTAAWSLRAEYRQVEQPTADPFELAAGGTSPSEAIQAAAESLGHRDVSSWLAPTVRTWKGGDALGRFDWRFSSQSSLGVRAGFASWTEANPLIGSTPDNGAGGGLTARDLSVATTFNTAGEGWASETRLGVQHSTREWTVDPLPATLLVGDGIGFGGAAAVPGKFATTTASLAEVASFSSGAHAIKVGVGLHRHSISDDWLPGANGSYTFGDAGTFTAGTGAYYHATRSGAVPSVAASYISLFAEDALQLGSSLRLIGTVSGRSERLPQGIIRLDTAFTLVSALNNTLEPAKVTGQVGARGGIEWEGGRDGATRFLAGVGVGPESFDLTALSEAVQFDGAVTVHRATGVLDWPVATQPTLVGPSLTMFDQGVRSPRTFKVDASLSQRLTPGMTFTVRGGYDHTDYLLRRSDLNRVQAPLATMSDGRPVFGALQQYGGLLVPGVGTNRRFRDFDMAYLLSSTGYADYYSATASLEQQLNAGLSVLLSYTWSKTTDDLPGQLSGDLADQLSPFPVGSGSTDWADGRSDLDVPMRVAASAEYRHGGLTLGARFRYRSGLPFTPGFRQGVDANGDGAGGNDPAPLSGVQGMAALAAQSPCLAGQAAIIAARNSCRDPAVHGLDLHLGLGLPFGGVSLQVDAFNVVSSDAGLFDHAAVLVDPAGSLTYDAAGRLVLPLIANDHFGQLLVRRGTPRAIRIGLRVEE